MEKKEREDRDIDTVELVHLTDSDDELWHICFVLLNDVIHNWLRKAQQIDPR